MSADKLFGIELIKICLISSNVPVIETCKKVQYHSTLQDSGPSPIVLPSLALVLVSVIMLAISYFIIPLYLKAFKPASNVNPDLANARTSFNIKKLMFAIFSIGIGIVVLITFKLRIDNGSAPVQIHIMIFILNVILLLLVLDHDALTFTKRYLYQLVTNVSAIHPPRWLAAHVRRGGLSLGPTRVFVISLNQPVEPVTAQAYRHR